MSLWLDVSYMNQISCRLEKFKVKRPNALWNFKCPICGDSSKKANKIRGYFITKGNQLNLYCHNCGASMSFGKFLQGFDKNLHDRYAVEKFKESRGELKSTPKKSDSDLVLEAIKKIPKTQKFIPDVTASLKKIDDLSSSHPARQYVTDRNIPESFWSQLSYAPKFFNWAAEHTDKFHHVKADHPRLVIPWYTEDGMLFAYSARTFGKESPKYYNVVLDTNHPKFYGLERVNRSKRIYVCEGQFDSMFIPNCVAVGTSAIHQFESSGDVTYIPDRDIRNNEIMKIAKRLIDSGKDVCMLPQSLNGKDINEMMLKNNLSENDILNIIDSNTYSGLEAELRFTQWGKV